MRNGICPKMRPGSRCPYGYYVRGTVQGERDPESVSGENEKNGGNRKRESYRDKVAKNIPEGIPYFI